MEGHGEDDVVKKRTIRRAAGVFISIAAIALIFKLTETNLTWDMISRARPEMLIFAFVLHSFFWFSWALRLKTLSSYLEHKVPYRNAVEITLASVFLASITPSSAGGEPARIKMLGDRDMGIGSASAVAIAERTLDASFFIVALPLLLILSGFSTDIGMIVGIVFAVPVIIFIFLLSRLVYRPERIDFIMVKIHPLLKRFLKEERAERVSNRVRTEVSIFSKAALSLAGHSSTQLAIVFLFTSCIWLSEFLVPSALLVAFHQDPFVLYSVTSQLILVMLSLIPITPGASGIAEVGMSYLYSNFVNTYTLGLLVGLWRGVTYFSNLIIGFIVTAKIFKTRY